MNGAERLKRLELSERRLEMIGLGKTLIFLGIVLVILGMIFVLGGRIPWLGHLPGDIYIQRERFTFYFPLMTCLIISVIISLVLYFLRR